MPHHTQVPVTPDGALPAAGAPDQPDPVNPRYLDELLGAGPESLSGPSPLGVRSGSRRLWLFLGAVVVLVAAGVWAYLRLGAGEAVTYRFAEVERGGIEATVGATGTLGPVTAVAVGTQVSGQISGVYVDFNDRVRAGQLIARIDPTLQEQAVRDAEAGLQRAETELLRAERDFARSRQLRAAEVVTERELEVAQYELDMARAAATSARVALDRARNNLAYTLIHAPIDGVVVERNVDAGQTVAASLQAPQLFLIADDLERLQILAAVDESDIGLIRPDLPVRFTVQAYPGRRFSGEVRQVRLQSVTRDNVVTYTVVVDVENADGRLLPGMTATVSFVTGTASDVLLVPNAALRFRPTEAMLAEAGVESAPPSVPGLWHQAEDGRLAMIPVRTGLTDGQRTEVSGEGLTAGMQVLVGAVQAGDRGGLLSPFQPTGRTGPPRPAF